MWCCWTPGLEPAVLHLGVVAELGAPADRAARPEMGERPDPDLVLHLGRLERRWPRSVQSRPMVVSMSWLPAPIERPGADPRPAPEDDVRLEDDVRREDHLGVDVGRRRVVHRHAGQEMAAVDPLPEAVRGVGQLGPVVDPGERAVVADLDAPDRPAVGPGERDELGQVQLTGHRRRSQIVDPAAEPGSVEDVDAGVDLVDLELVLGGVLASTIRSTSPSSSRTTRPRRPGSMVTTLTRREGRPGRRGARRAARRRRLPPEERARRRTGRGSRRRRWAAPPAAAWSASPVPTRLRLEGEIGPLGERVADRPRSAASRRRAAARRSPRGRASRT